MWATLFIMGLIFFPLTSCIFKSFHDNGWMFSKILGAGISGILVWLLSYMKILKFTTINCYIIISILLIINIIIFIKCKKKIDISANKIKNIIITEIIFCVVFILWVFIRSYDVPINKSTEKFMNYGFINSIINSEYMPAEDMWLSGNSINYYYFGHYISAYLIKISMSEVNEGYNLMMALVASFTFILPYTIAYNLGIALIKGDERKRSIIIPNAIAIMTGISLMVGGTLYYPIYNWFAKDESRAYFYADATRYIGYRPDTNDKTITEIPSYSSLVGDLHAHYTDLIFVFTTLALLLQVLMNEKEENKTKRILNLDILILGILLGIQKMTNYWDFPIYLVVISAIMIANNIVKHKITRENILITLAQIVEIIVIEELVTYPFSRDLYISATEVRLTHVTSPLHKLAVLWALPTICVLWNIIHTIFKLIKQRKNKFMNNVRNLKKSDIYVLILGMCAIGLVILPEIIYLKDIYGETYKRANTMFKLTYQAYVLFSVSISYILIKLIYEKGMIIRKIVASLILIVYFTTFIYGVDAIRYKVSRGKSEDLHNSENYIKENYYDDYQAIQWIKENIDRHAVILEAVGASFTDSSFISVFTGNPTVLGWYAHEWIWRADEDYNAPQEVIERQIDINGIYKGYSISNIKDCIEKYNISYIYLGGAEYKKYLTNANSNLGSIISIGEIVYQNDGDVHDHPVCIVKVK